MKTAKDFPSAAAYARYLLQEFPRPKYITENMVAARIRDGVTDIDKLLADKMSKTEQGRMAARKSPVNPFNPGYLKRSV